MWECRSIENTFELEYVITNIYYYSWNTSRMSHFCRMNHCFQLSGNFLLFGMHCTCALREYEVEILFEVWKSYLRFGNFILGLKTLFSVVLEIVVIRARTSAKRKTWKRGNGQKLEITFPSFWLSATSAISWNMEIWKCGNLEKWKYTWYYTCMKRIVLQISQSLDFYTRRFQ